MLEARLGRARAGVALVRRERRADPSVGLRGGREGDHSLIGITLEVPVSIRNRFDERVEAARARALEIEQRRNGLRRGVLARARAAIQRYQTMQDTWERWRRLSAPVLVEQERLIETLWDAGAIDARDYLLQFDQVLNARIGGLELRERLWTAWIDWLQATGQVAAWLHLEDEAA